MGIRLLLVNPLAQMLTDLLCMYNAIPTLPQLLLYGKYPRPRRDVCACFSVASFSLIFGPLFYPVPCPMRARHEEMGRRPRRGVVWMYMCTRGTDIQYLRAHIHTMPNKVLAILSTGHTFLERYLPSSLPYNRRTRQSERNRKRW